MTGPTYPDARILSVDDQESNLRLMELVLKQGGYACYRSVSDSRQALSVFREFQPDLVLLDLMMPPPDGVAVIEQLRPLAADTYLPIVVLTADATAESKRRALAAGAKDFLTKPLDAVEVLLRIENLLETRFLYQKLQQRADRFEAQFIQAQRLEAVGMLAGGVAHDFNNLLTVILGFSEVVLGELPRDEPVHDRVQQIRNAAKRAAALTRQLLAFSRKQTLAPVILNLNDLVSETEKLLRRLIGEDVVLTTVLDPALGRVNADPGQVEQVLMNLAVNARDAMPTGGRLTIETRNVDMDAAAARQHPEGRPGLWVVLAVRDTGCGMDEATRARIFEPFFTTKEAGKGTGLGLATVYGIVKQSGGFLEVNTAPGRGTTFEVYLPYLAHAPTPVSGSQPDLARLPRGTGTVLLVEDEEGVRTLAGVVLSLAGYTVLEARDGKEALKVCASHAGPIDLVVTDVVMPEMSGRELVDRIAALRAELKVLFVSGYTESDVLRHGVGEAATAFLQKPFTPSVLARKVHEMLGH